MPMSLKTRMSFLNLRRTAKATVAYGMGIAAICALFTGLLLRSVAFHWSLCRTHRALCRGVWQFSRKKSHEQTSC